DRQVALTDVHAVRAAGPDEVRPVVEDEERAVPLAGAPERLGGGDELVVGQSLRAQLHDVDPAVERRVEQRLRHSVGDEVEAGASELRAPGKTVHRPDASLRAWSMPCSWAGV